MTKDGIIEILECAVINCDNVKSCGLLMIEIVKEQIKEAIKLLEAD